MTWRDLRIELDASTVSLEHAERLQQHIELTRATHETPPPTESQTEESTETFAEKATEKTARVTLTETPLVSNPTLDNWDELRDIVSLDPKFAIHLAGEVLDGVTRKVADKPHPFGSLAITKSMQNNPKISPSLADGVFQLQRYRNLVAGNTQTIVAVHDAINFIDNVEKAVDLLETALNST